jgi:hypothetical protein
MIVDKIYRCPKSTAFHSIQEIYAILKYKKGNAVT